MKQPSDWKTATEYKVNRSGRRVGKVEGRRTGGQEDRGQEDRVAHRVEIVDRGDLSAQVLAHDVGHRGEGDAVHVPDGAVDPVDQKHEPPLRIQAKLRYRLLLQFHSIPFIPLFPYTDSTPVEFSIAPGLLAFITRCPSGILSVFLNSPLSHLHFRGTEAINRSRTCQSIFLV